MDKLPDFLIVGAGKSGTTSLNNYLNQHPDIFMSPLKEPNFFAYVNIDLNTLDKDALEHYKSSITRYDDYTKLFKDAQPQQKIGEVSNTYLVVPGSAESIKKYIPDVKIIAILRHPTQRLYSRYLHLARENELPTNDFSDVLDKDSIWWVRNDLVKEGFYYKNLKRYFDRFPASQIKVILYDDLKNDMQKVMDEIFNFIDVPTVTVNTSVEFNKSGFIKNKFYDKTLGHRSIFKTFIKSIVSERTFNRLRESRTLQKAFNDLKEKNLAKPRLENDLSKEITEEIYKADIKKLESLINRDLRHWYE